MVSIVWLLFYCFDANNYFTFSNNASPCTGLPKNVSTLIALHSFHALKIASTLRIVMTRLQQTCEASEWQTAHRLNTLNRNAFLQASCN